MKFTTSFKFREDIFLNDTDLVGYGNTLEESQENFIAQITQKIRAVIQNESYRLDYQIRTEHGFYISSNRLDGVPPKQDEWKDWCLVVCCPWDDDNTRDGPYRYTYLYVPKGSIIKKISSYCRSRVEKIKVGSDSFQFLSYDLDSCWPGLFELPNFSYVWIKGNWISKLTFGG